MARLLQSLLAHARSIRKRSTVMLKSPFSGITIAATAATVIFVWSLNRGSILDPLMMALAHCLLRYLALLYHACKSRITPSYELVPFQAWLELTLFVPYLGAANQAQVLKWISHHNLSYLTITNWRLLLNLHVKPPMILDRHSTKIDKF